jgi:HAD superfamily hydrolase (TIGR01509 family)
MTIQYIFWDSDNTMVNTAAHHWNKHLETLKSLGIHLDEQWQERIYINNGSQNWEWLTAELGLEMDLQDYLDTIDAWYYRHIDEIAIRDGVLDALALFESANLPMCVVSNGRRRSVMASLEAKNLAPRFKFILCKEDYQGRKPEPGPYLAAKTRMQQIMGHEIDPQVCLVIEDDPKGVESGLAAGMHVLHRSVDNHNTQEFLENCHRLIKS